MIVLLAGFATVILVISEIIALAPMRWTRQLRATLLWGAVAVLVMFTATWLVAIQALLSQTP